MRKTVFTRATFGLLTTITAFPASADPPARGGCQAFGGNVATLGQKLGSAFGATASGVATSGPQTFPTLRSLLRAGAVLPLSGPPTVGPGAGATLVERSASGWDSGSAGA